MTLALYGGSFNPPHNGHAALAKNAVEELRPDKLIWMPAGNPPHKTLPEGTPSAEQRLAMNRLAAQGVPRAEVSGFELSGGASYTADTVHMLFERYKPDKLWLCVGSDMNIDSWRRADEIRARCELFTFPRDIVPVSSTEIRALLERGQGEDMLPRGVFEYIKKEGLYGFASLTAERTNALRGMLRERLSPRRVLHTLGVEGVAACMAMRWGAHTEKARQAALLHDMTKEEPDQLKLMEQYDILPLIWKETVPNVYHALTGAALAKDMGFCGDVVSAVRWHATGRADMTVLEKIIFIADMAEPFRKCFDGLSEIRGLLYTDIDRAVTLGLRQTLRFLSENNRPQDRFTAEALDWLDNTKVGS